VATGTPATSRLDHERLAGPEWHRICADLPFQTLSQQFRVVNEWIAAAGGRSVTADQSHHHDHLSLSLEQIIAWDPEVLLLWSEADRRRLADDPRFARLTAVRTGRVHVAPSIAHPWASWTAEHPLMVLWTAQRLHPSRFSADEVLATTRRYYQRFGGVTFSHAELRDRLSL